MLMLCPADLSLHSIIFNSFLATAMERRRTGEWRREGRCDNREGYRREEKGEAFKARRGKRTGEGRVGGEKGGERGKNREELEEKGGGTRIRYVSPKSIHCVSLACLIYKLFDLFYVLSFILLVKSVSFFVSFVIFGSHSAL